MRRYYPQDKKHFMYIIQVGQHLCDGASVRACVRACVRAWVDECLAWGLGPGGGAGPLVPEG